MMVSNLTHSEIASETSLHALIVTGAYQFPINPLTAGAANIWIFIFY